MFAHMGRMKRRVRKRLNIKPRKQMMHHRIADEDHLGNLVLAAAGKFADHPPQGEANDRLKIVAVQSCANPAHHVGAER